MSFFWRRFLSVPDASGDVLSPPDFFSSLPVLETRDLILRRPRRGDAADIFEYSSDPEVSRYVLWDPHRSLADAQYFVRELRRRIRLGWPSSWVVVLRQTGKVIGTIGYVCWSSDHGYAELGYSFSRRYWNRGYATQALGAVVDVSFRRLPFNRLEAQHDVRNPASGRVMEKCGLRREGILRGRVRNKGEYVNVVLYAILREDWQKAQR